jgi:hypothetical protein
MIKVPFTVEAHEVRNGNDISHFLQRYRDMPWLVYLLKNAIKVESEKFYDSASFQYVVNFHFQLEPKKETFYRIKYGDGL